MTHLLDEIFRPPVGRQAQRDPACRLAPPRRPLSKLALRRPPTQVCLVMARGRRTLRGTVAVASALLASLVLLLAGALVIISAMLQEASAQLGYALESVRV